MRRLTVMRSRILPDGLPARFSGWKIPRADRCHQPGEGRDLRFASAAALAATLAVSDAIAIAATLAVSDGYPAALRSSTPRRLYGNQGLQFSEAGAGRADDLQGFGYGTGPRRTSAGLRLPGEIDRGEARRSRLDPGSGSRLQHPPERQPLEHRRSQAGEELLPGAHACPHRRVAIAS